jgi:hypothetical protein
MTPCILVEGYQHAVSFFSVLTSRLSEASFSISISQKVLLLVFLFVITLPACGKGERVGAGNESDLLRVESSLRPYTSSAHCEELGGTARRLAPSGP